VAAAPITMSVSDPGIKAGDTIYEVTTRAWSGGTATVDGRPRSRSRVTRRSYRRDGTVRPSALTITTRTARWAAPSRF